MPKIFTLPLVASQTYTINSQTAAIGITIINEPSSSGGISVTGTAKAYINDVAMDSAPIVYGPGQMQSIALDTPGVDIEITTAAGTTGKILIVV